MEPWQRFVARSIRDSTRRLSIIERNRLRRLYMDAHSYPESP